jgi:hypothetical protein
MNPIMDSITKTFASIALVFPEFPKQKHGESRQRVASLAMRAATLKEIPCHIAGIKTFIVKEPTTIVNLASFFESPIIGHREVDALQAFCSLLRGEGSAFFIGQMREKRLAYTVSEQDGITASEIDPSFVWVKNGDLFVVPVDAKIKPEYRYKFNLVIDYPFFQQIQHLPIS